MKRKKTDWSKVPWTPFTLAHDPTPEDIYTKVGDRPPDQMFLNSRYQVAVWHHDGPWGPMAHLSFKVRDKQAHHDWRDMQRIKNELCGPESEAVELFPAESRMVDAANQYHLWVFKDFKFPFGFKDRLVADGTWGNSRQRPWRPDERPADCKASEEYGAALDALSTDWTCPQCGKKNSERTVECGECGWQ